MSDYFLPLILGILSLLISIIALAFSLYVYRTHDRHIKKLERELYQLQNDYYRSLQQKEKQASLRAEYAKTEEWNYIIIYNEGHSSAKNVRIEPDDIDLQFGIFYAERTFRFPVLNPNEKCKITVFLSVNHARKPMITLIWDDEYSSNNRKDCVLSIS